MSAQLAIAEPRRIKATHRRRRRIASGPSVQRYYDPQVGRFLSADPAASEFNRYSYAGNNPYKFVDPDGRVKVDANGNVVFTPTDAPAEKHYETRISEDFKSSTTISWEAQSGYIEADDGTRISASMATGEIQVTIETDAGVTRADASVLGDGSTPTSNTANCHGTTFAKGQVWIEPSQVGALLKGDGYTQTSSPRPGDVAVFPGPDSPAAHSATVRTTGAGGVESVQSKAGTQQSVVVPPADAWSTAPVYYTR